MDSVRLQLKNSVKQLANDGINVRKEIFNLKWKPETASEARALLALSGQDPAASGRKKKLREMARPETGPQRYKLWDDKRAIKSVTRTMQLAYAFVRGALYRSVEPKCDSAPWGSSIFFRIQDCLSEDQQDLLSEKAVHDWLDGAEVPTAFLEAIYPPRKAATLVSEASLEASC